MRCGACCSVRLRRPEGEQHAEHRAAQRVQRDGDGRAGRQPLRAVTRVLSVAAVGTGEKRDGLLAEFNKAIDKGA